VNSVGGVARVDGQSFVNHHRAQARTSRGLADAVIASRLRSENNTTHITFTNYNVNIDLDQEKVNWSKTSRI
jgi:hypothetical protein